MAHTARLLGDRIRRPIAEAVQQAEEKTAAEFVPVIATTSDRYERAEDMVGLIFALIAVLIVGVVVGIGDDGVTAWLAITALILSVIFGFIVGVLCSSQLRGLRRLFVSQQRRYLAVSSRARQVFVDRRVHQTAGGTGVVLFISLFERMGLVLADQAIKDHLSEGTLDDYSRRLTETLQSGGDVGDALVAVISELGERLGEVLPRYEDDLNELPDALVLLD